MRSILAAFKLTWFYIISVTILSLLISFGIFKLGLLEIVISDTDFKVLFGIKVGIVSIITSAILFFYRLFWDDLNLMKQGEYPELVIYYKGSFVTLFLSR